MLKLLLYEGRFYILMKQKIAVDICNTIADVNAVLKEMFGEVPNPSSRFTLTKSFFEKNLWIFESAKPITGSMNKLNELNKDYEIVYITARPEDAKDVTLDWLKRHNYPDGDVLFTTDKALLARSLEIKLAFDDAPHEIANYLRSGINVMVKDQDYNSKFSNRFEWNNLKVKDLEFEIKPKRNNEYALRTIKEEKKLEEEWELEAQHQTFSSVTIILNNREENR